MKQILLSFVLFFFSASQIYAMPASLSLNPTDIKTKTGQEFQIQVNMFSGNEAIASADVMINYDHTLLTPVIQKTKNGSIFPSVDSKIIIPGKLYIYGFSENKNEFVSAQGTLATVTFRALQNGQTDIKFDCNPQIKNTSQIIAANNNFENIISCTATIAHTSQVTINDGTVLGAYTDTYGTIHAFTAIFGVLVAVFTFFIFTRYQRLQKNI